MSYTVLVSQPFRQNKLVVIGIERRTMCIKARSAESNFLSVSYRALPTPSLRPRLWFNALDGVLCLKASTPSKACAFVCSALILRSNPRRGQRCCCIRLCLGLLRLCQYISLGIHPEEVKKASRCRRGYWPRKHSGLVDERQRDRATCVDQRMVAGTRRAGLEVTMDRTASGRTESEV